MLKAYTLLHVLISLVAIVAGVVLFGGMALGQSMMAWVNLFLWTTLATSVTGFFFPYTGFRPSYVVGMISLLLLAAAFWAGNPSHVFGEWVGVFFWTSFVAFYLNVFVLLNQMFQKIPALNRLAPTQKERPFLILNLIVLLLFAFLGLRARQQAPTLFPRAPIADLN